MTRPRTTRSGAEAPLVVYGANAVLELLRSGEPVDRVCLGRGPRGAELSAAALARGVRVEAADRPALDRLAGSPHHQGAVAVAPPFAYAPPERLLAPPRSHAWSLPPAPRWWRAARAEVSGPSSIVPATSRPPTPWLLVSSRSTSGWRWRSPSTS